MELKISYQKSADGYQTKSLKHERILSESKCGDRKKYRVFIYSEGRKGRIDYASIGQK
jgi:hypothetical protein